MNNYFLRNGFMGYAGENDLLGDTVRAPENITKRSVTARGRKRTPITGEEATVFLQSVRRNDTNEFGLKHLENYAFKSCKRDRGAAVADCRVRAIP